MRNSSVHIPTSPGFHLIACFLMRRMKLYTFLLFSIRLPNGHSTSNRHRFDIDITSIHRKPNFGQFSRHSHVLFWCNFADRKVCLVSTYFFRRNFDDRKIHVDSTYIFRRTFDGGKILVVSTFYFQCDSDGQIIHVVSTYFFGIISLVKKST